MRAGLTGAERRFALERVREDILLVRDSLPWPLRERALPAIATVLHALELLRRVVGELDG